VNIIKHPRKASATVLLSFMLPTLLATSPAVASVFSVTGRIEAALVLANAGADSLPSWQSKGVGSIRAQDNQLEWQQGFVNIDYALNKNWKANAVINAYADGEKHLGFTQAYLQYKPLSPNHIKFKSKLGMFYPAMSVENTAEGWLSPYTYTQSAINSWVGEELRVFGGEASLFANGRKRRSPWSWEANVGVFKGNDPLGTLLAWRGFAMHDRQSLHNDRIEFAPIPSVLDERNFASPSWLEPFTEIDGNWGAYFGFHLSYLRKSNMRYYFYDNRADPNAINQDRLYGWHTKFHSVAYQHQLDPNWRIMLQLMKGSTLMGKRSVYADFQAAYIAVSYAQKAHHITLRLDYHDVAEDDIKPQDPNNSHGQGYTAAWRYQYTPSIELGAEFNQHNTFVENRAQLNFEQEQRQSQIRLVLAYIF